MTTIDEPFPHLKALAVSWRRTFGPLPGDLVAVDIEADPKLDLLLQVGWCVIRGGRAVARESRRLAWEDVLPPDRATALRIRMEKIFRGRKRWMTERGVPPAVALRDLVTAVERTPVLVTFNGWRFDVPILQREATAVGLRFPVRDTTHVDAGALVKAARTGVLPRPGETYRSFADRALRGKRGVRWSLEKFWCPAVGCRPPEGEEHHDARTDAWLTHRVVEWVRAAGG